VLSHSAGLVRDGKDSGQFSGRRPFPDAQTLIADRGFASLVGLVIEAVTGEPFCSFSKREVSDAAGLKETHPDKAAPIASGHGGKLLFVRRIAIPGDYPTSTIAPAGGGGGAAGDLALFFAQLSPNARRSVRSVASRREMVRHHTTAVSAPSAAA
jgi:CubicO group peptidase (beta-lactamase class C family)